MASGVQACWLSSPTTSMAGEATGQRKQHQITCSHAMPRRSLNLFFVHDGYSQAFGTFGRLLNPCCMSGLYLILCNLIDSSSEKSQLTLGRIFWFVGIACGSSTCFFRLSKQLVSFSESFNMGVLIYVILVIQLIDREPSCHCSQPTCLKLSSACRTRRS